MKRAIAWMLALALILCAAAAAAEEAGEKTRLGTLQVGTAFVIRSRIPENCSFEVVTSTDLNLVGTLSGGENGPFVVISIGYSEEFADVERFNDVDGDAVERIRRSFLEMDDVTLEDLETAHGTRLLKATAADGSFVDIYTIYKGYELEFVMASPDGKIRDEDVRMLVDFISDMDFVPAE